MLSDKLKSKKGISLPLAMAIVSVLVILSASLIAIAGTSVMSTSSTVNSRQAYLNVRSALEYAYAYYNNPNYVDDLSKINGNKTAENPDGEPQYMIMKDDWFMNDSSASGVKDRSAWIGTATEANSANTYVTAQYIAPKVTGESALLKLTAYSKSTDAFGNRGESVHMSASYVVNVGSNKNRVTMTDIDTDTDVTTYNAARNAISLHCKQLPGQDWTPFYYLWTYEDRDMTTSELKGHGGYSNEAQYKGYGGSDKMYGTATTCYDVDAKYKFVEGNIEYDQALKLAAVGEQRINRNEDTVNTHKVNGKDVKYSHAPNGVWNVYENNYDDRNGPPSCFVPSSGGWYNATYYINDDYVNYFNLIITKKGQVLKKVIGVSGGDKMTEASNVQSNEMFHLWFLTADDRNIYIEFLQPTDEDEAYEKNADNKTFKLVNGNKVKAELKYHMGTDWNGLDGLDDRFLVYVNNQKTTVHFRVKDMDDNVVELEDGRVAPLISQIYIGGADINDTSNTKFTQGLKYSRFGAAADSNRMVWGSTTPYFWSSISAGDDEITQARLDYFPEKFKNGATNYDYNVFKRMMYEGCGWWVANIPTGVPFTMGIDYYDTSGVRMGRGTVTVTPNSNKEAFVVADPTTGSIYSRLTESVACALIGADYNSYSTIRYKASAVGMVSVPRLDYSADNVSIPERRKLRERIEEVYRDYSAADFKEESYNKLIEVLEKAMDVYNKGEKWLKDNASASDDEKKAHFNAEITKINNAVKGLQTETASGELLEDYNNTVKRAEDLIAEQNREFKYDSGVFASFIAEGSAYKIAKQNQNDIATGAIEITTINSYIENLKTAITTLTASDTTTNRNNLITAIENAYQVAGNGAYDETMRNNLNAMLSTGYNKTETTNEQNETVKTFTFSNSPTYGSVEDLAFSEAMNDDLKRAYEDLTDFTHQVEAASSTEALKDQISALSNLIYKVDKFIKANKNSTASLLADLKTARNNAETVMKTTKINDANDADEVKEKQDLLSDEKDKLQAVYNNSKIVKPNAALSVNAMTDEELTAAKKTRIWFKGFNLKNTSNKTHIIDKFKVVDTDGNEIPNDPLYNFDYVVDGLSAFDVLKGVSRGTNISEYTMGKIYPNELMYYDYTTGTNDALELQLTVNKCENLTYNNTVGDYEYQAIRAVTFTSEITRHSGSGSVYCFDGLEAVYQGNDANGDRIYKYVLKVSVGKLTELYIDGPVGTKVIVTDKDGNVETLATNNEGSGNDIYRVARFITGSNKKAMVNYTDEDTNKRVITEYINFNPDNDDNDESNYYVDPGKFVVKLDKSAALARTDVTVQFKYENVKKGFEAYGYYNGTFPALDSDYGDTREAPVDVAAGEIAASSADSVYVVLLNSDNTVIRKVAAEKSGEYYNVVFDYVPGMKVKIEHTAVFTRQGDYPVTYTKQEYNLQTGGKAWFYTPTQIDKTVKETFTTNAMTIPSVGDYSITMNDKTSIAGTKLADSTVKYNTVLYKGADILGSLTTASSGSGVSAKADTMLTSLVSENFAADMAVNTSLIDSAVVEHTTYFDYFGQNGLAVTPTMNIGSTVIWIDQGIKLGGKSLDEISQTEPLKIYVWGENGAALLGTNDNPAPMIKVEDTDCYYVVVDSSARGCKIKRTDTNEWINTNNSDNHNFYFDDTGTHSGQDATPYFLAKTPAGSKISGQGYCEPYVIITQQAIDGDWMYEDRETRKKTRVYYGYPEYKNAEYTDEYEYQGITHYEMESGHTQRIRGYYDYYTVNLDGRQIKRYENGWNTGYYFEYGGYRYTLDSSLEKYLHPVYGTLTGHTGDKMARYKYRGIQQIKPPTYNVSYDEGAALDNRNLRMPFVGGSKLRIVNESYYATYGGQYFRLAKNNGSWLPYLDYMQNSRYDAKIGNTSGYSLFGGKGDNNNSDGRVGDARLYIMYDWYEYKIPVDQSNTYKFQISGVLFTLDENNTIPWSGNMYSDTGRYTAQMTNIYGDVYVVMNSTIIGKDDDNRYRDLVIYTQNPDNVEMEEIERIYFQTAEEDTNKSWLTEITTDANGNDSGGITVTAWGVDKPTTYFFHQVETGSTLYYADIPAKTPFLIISAKRKNGDKDAVDFIAKTTLQGDDKCLFNPKLGGGFGAWENYVSDTVARRRALYAAQGLYYSKVIPKEIGSDYQVVDKGSSGTYNFPEAIKKQFITASNFSDGNVLNTSTVNVSTVNRWVDAYTDMYNLMSKAKAYLGERDGSDIKPFEDENGHKYYYPEYKYNNTPNIYDRDSLLELFKVLKTCEEHYLAEGTDVSTIEEDIVKLTNTINGVKLSTKGMIAFIYYDTQGVVNLGSTFGVQYYLTEADALAKTNLQTRKIEYFNTDGCPIVFIKANEVYDVAFTINGSAQEKLPSASILDGAWVYMDIATKPYWVQNTVADYNQSNVSEYTQTSKRTSCIYEMKPQQTKLDEIPGDVKTLAEAQSASRPYQPVTLYFKNDTTVTYDANLEKVPEYKTGDIKIVVHFNNGQDESAYSGKSSSDSYTEGHGRNKKTFYKYYNWNLYYWWDGDSTQTSKNFEGTIDSNGMSMTFPVTEAQKEKGTFNFIYRCTTYYMADGSTDKVNTSLWADQRPQGSGNQYSVNIGDDYQSGTIHVYYNFKSNDASVTPTVDASGITKKATAASTEPDIKTYTIRAGAYSFSKDMVSVPEKNGEVYEDTKESTYKDCPFVYCNPTGGNKDGSGAWTIQCDLFSNRAMTYFTTPKNYLKLVTDGAYIASDADDAAAMGTTWVTKSADGKTLELKPGTYNSAKNVNMTANSGSFLSGRQYYYITTGDMYFRWEGNNTLKVNNNVTMIANTVRICSSGTIDATYTANKHFRIGKHTATKMTVIFGTDLEITYLDSFNEVHKFTIREGEYEVSQPPKFSGRNYICDLCDEEYWTSMEYVTIKNRYNAGGGYNGTEGSGRLTNPVYG